MLGLQREHKSTMPVSVFLHRLQEAVQICQVLAAVVGVCT